MEIIIKDNKVSINENKSRFRLRKFVLFLGLILLGTIILSGAVSATASTSNVSVNSVSTHKLAHIEILGQVKKCSDGTPFEGATVTVKQNGTRITSTTTKTDGTYTLKFQSQSRLFTVIANANGHKPSAQKVSVIRNTPGTYTGKANFKLGNNDAYVYKGWISNPSQPITFSDETTIDGTAPNAFTTIADGITYATGKPGVNTVYIAPSTYYEHDLVIDSDVNIHGEDQATTIIDANNLGRVFIINSGKTVTITKLTLKNGNTAYGGAIYNEGTLSVKDSTFTDNSASYDGGAIYNTGGTSITPVTISGSTFNGNSATGGAVYNTGFLTVTGCTFPSNTGNYGYGGAIYNSGFLTVTGSNFTSNTASFAGAIYNNGALTVTNSTFNGNTASFAGAIYNTGALTVTNSTFNGNTAAGGAGAIFNSGALTVTGSSTFTSNTATSGFGGAIYNSSSGALTISGSKFNGNSATNGGAIYNMGFLTMTGSTFTGNSAAAGGAIYNTGGTSLTPVTISGCTFGSSTSNGNTATDGGAIYNTGVLTIMGSSTFTSNTATDGGAIFNEYTGILTVTDSTFTVNTASYCGGVIYNNGGTCTVTGSTFTGNTATINGGAIYNDGTLSVTGCTFTSNHATTNGGAIYNGSSAIVHFNRIVGNTAGAGGAVYSNGGTVDAEFNWWGDNNGPSGKISGFIVNKWLVLTVTANPIIISNGGSSIITADLTHDNTNAPQTGGYVPDGIPVSFITTLGTMGTPSSMVNGVSEATLHAGTVSGPATVTATIDNQPVPTLVTIDTTPPVVSSIDPVNNVKINVVNKVITVTFSEPILAGSTYDSISVTGPSGTVTMTKNIIGNVLTLTPTSNYANGNYNINIPINSVTDLANNGLATTSKSTFTIDTIPPTVSTNLYSGTYNTNKLVTLYKSEPGLIYYTLNGNNPTTISSKYSTPISITKTTSLKYFEVDMAGNKSPIYTKTFTIDKIPPKVTKTTPTNLKTGVSRTSTISLIFSEKIKASTYFSSIKVKNLKTGKYLNLSRTTIGNKLNIKTSTKTVNTWYQVIIPAKAIKDYAGNNILANYTFKFKTGA